MGSPPVAHDLGIGAPRAKAPEPKVVLDGSMLSIAAGGSTLGEVLRAVQSATGADVEFPGDASELVDVDLGPAKERDVLTALLDSSRFDYVLVSADQRPDSIVRIILAERRDASMPRSTSRSSNADNQALASQKADIRNKDPRSMDEIVQQQQRQFERQFGDCRIQGCDAS